MVQELIKIIEKVREKITDNSDVAWTGYDTPVELRDEVSSYIQQLRSGDITCLDELNRHFLPTCTFQEHSISNNWEDEYLSLAEKFDHIYAMIKKS